MLEKGFSSRDNTIEKEREMSYKLKTVKVAPKGTTKTYQSQLIISVWPVYLITKAAGLLSIQVIRKGDDIVVKTNWKDVCYFMSYLIIYGSCSIYMLNVIRSDTQYKILSPVLIFIMTILMLLQMFVTIISSFIYRMNIAKIFRKVSDVDKILYETMQIAMNYNSVMRQSLKIIAMLCISSIMRTIVTTMTIDIDVIEKFGLFEAALIKSLTKYTFGLLASIICRRFIQINIKLKTYVNRNIPNDVLSRDIEILCNLHFKLCNITRILDKTFSLQILVSLGITLADILFHSYYLYSTIKDNYFISNPTMVVCPILWLIDETIELYDLINHCNETCVQVFKNLQKKIVSCITNSFRQAEVRFYCTTLLMVLVISQLRNR